MEPYDWDTKIGYLSKTRWLYYNNDYIEFLVKNVWKIDKPVHMIDFGCGYGYLGLLLLPFMPEGTKYTGIDAGVQLISRAKALYQDLPYEAEFIVGDIQHIALESKYDMAVCHAFLMHMPNPIEILRKMTECIVDQGRIVCFESNWIAGAANSFVHGIDQSNVIQLGILQKLYETDTKREGKDGNIGMKLPVYLSQLGVKNVQCRVSDKVNFLDPHADPEKMNVLFDSLMEDGFGTAPGEREPFTRNLMDRGVHELEAQQQYENELVLYEAFIKRPYVTSAANMKITFGTVVK